MLENGETPPLRQGKTPAPPALDRGVGRRILVASFVPPTGARLIRFRFVPLAAALLAPACKVAPTPREYFDHQMPAAVERQAAVEEIQDRILAMGQALNRGNTDAAMIALAPAPDAYVITPDDTLTRQGAEEIGAILERGASGPVELREVVVQVGPRQNVAWFRAVMVRTEEEGGAAQALRLSGVYVRNEGAWQLVQAHLSSPTLPPAPPTESPEPAAAPAGGG